MTLRWLLVASLLAFGLCSTAHGDDRRRSCRWCAPDALPVSTPAPSTTAAPSSDPNTPLIAAVPEIDCAYADPLAGGEITFVVGDRLYGAAPDGTVLRCLAGLSRRAARAGRVVARRNPRTAERSWVYDVAGSRFSGFDVANVRVQWEWPTATGMFAPTASNRTLVRRDAADPNLRTEITFLAETMAAVAHPAGGVVLASGTAPDGTTGIFVATDTGQSTRMLVSTGDGQSATTVSITELGADAAGDVLYFIADNGTSSRIDQLTFGDLSVTELSNEQAPIVQLTTGPTRRTVAWRVGLCNSVTRTQGARRPDRGGRRRRHRHPDRVAVAVAGRLARRCPPGGRRPAARL